MFFITEFESLYCRSGNQGWERVFARLEHNALTLYSEDAPNGNAVDVFDLCPGEDVVVRVMDGVLPSELPWSVLSDLPYVFKVGSLW